MSKKQMTIGDLKHELEKYPEHWTVHPNYDFDRCGGVVTASMLFLMDNNKDVGRILIYEE